MYWCIIDVFYEDMTAVTNFETFLPNLAKLN
jgi:hypothetical protein